MKCQLCSCVCKFLGLSIIHELGILSDTLESRVHLAAALNDLLIIFDVKIICNPRDNTGKENRK